LAALARLELRAGEAESLCRDISSILDYVGQIEGAAVGAEIKESSAHHNVLREDTVRAAGDPLMGTEESVRAAFPRQERDYLVVQKILDKNA